MNHVSVKNLKG